MQRDVRTAGALGDGGGEACIRQIEFTVERRRHLQLQQLRTLQRTEGDLLAATAPAMPRIARQTAERQVGHHRAR